jgi:hypothetical protein
MSMLIEHVVLLLKDISLNVIVIDCAKPQGVEKYIANNGFLQRWL